jgi:flagellar M-ring protein FliF
MRLLKGGLGRATQTFAGFSAGQKAVSIVAVLALAVGGLLLSRWSSTPSYAPLFTGLTPADASAIVDELTASGTPYQLADGGGSILVPRENVYDARVRVSGKGLPAGETTGYSMLDKQGVTASEFQQQVGFQRAMEGELSKTIEHIDGVESAVVHLAIPKKDVFADEDGKPTASVLLETLPGREIEPQQVQAVVHLVSSSVEGLEPGKVTVADSKGRVLSTPGDGGAAGGGDLRAQQTEAYEDRMTEKVQQLVERVVGSGRAAVQVTADLDFDATERKSEEFSPAPNTPALSESSSQETYKGTGSTPGGVLGPDNIGVPNTTGGANNSYDKSQRTANNAVNKVTEQRKSAPGGVRRQHVSVLLDARAAGTVDPQQIEELVVSGAGIDAARGDTIAVGRLPFDDTAAKEAAAELEEKKSAEKKAALFGTLRTAGLSLLVFVVLVFTLLSARKRSRIAEEARRIELEALQRRVELEASKLRILEPAAAGTAALEAAPPTDPDAERLAVVRNEVTDLVESQPDEVAQLLRGWLADRRA